MKSKPDWIHPDWRDGGGTIHFLEIPWNPDRWRLSVHERNPNEWHWYIFNSHGTHSESIDTYTDANQAKYMAQEHFRVLAIDRMVQWCNLCLYMDGPDEDEQPEDEGDDDALRQ